jgi:hypothetical protein
MGLALTLLHCDKVCVFTHIPHIAAASVAFALWALIVSGDNGLNGSSKSTPRDGLALQGSYHRMGATAVFR